MSSHHCEHQAQQNQSGAGKMILATFAKAGFVTVVTADLCDWSFNQKLIYNNPATHTSSKSCHTSSYSSKYLPQFCPFATDFFHQRFTTTRAVAPLGRAMKYSCMTEGSF